MRSLQDFLSSGVTKSKNSAETKLTRRHVAALFAAVPVMAQQSPQTQKAKAQETTDSLEQAMADIRESSDRLRKIQLPVTVEPAFSFQA